MKDGGVLLNCIGRRSAAATASHSVYAAASSGTQPADSGMVISNIMSLAPVQKSMYADYLLLMTVSPLVLHMLLFVPPLSFPPSCLFCVLLFVWAASLMSVCFSGSLLSASIYCIHCNISIAQKINFD